MKLKYWMLLTSLLVAGAAPAQTVTTPNSALHALFDREWEWELSQDPLWASYLGDRRWNDRWPDTTSAAFAARHAHRQAVLKEITAISRDALSPADRLNYDIFKHQYETTVEGFQHRYHLIRTSTLDGVQNTEQVIDTLRFQTVKDYDDWLARLDAFPALVDQNIALMREGIRSNVVLPKIIGERVRTRLPTLVKQPAEQSGYLSAVHASPGSIAAGDRDRLTKPQAQEHVRTRVQPAFARLLEFLDREYLPASYDGVGWWQTGGGLAAYRYFARLYTTTDLDPAADPRARAEGSGADPRRRWKRIKTQVGFTGRSPEFFTLLRTDPQFFYRHRRRPADGYRAIAKRIDPELIEVIGTLPRLPYGVIAVPDAIAPNTTDRVLQRRARPTARGRRTSSSTCTSPRRGRNGR